MLVNLKILFSNMSQKSFFDQIGRESTPVFAQKLFEEGKTRIDFHWHERPQFIYSDNGAVEVITKEKRWLVPPSQGVWIPAQIDHAISAHKSLKISVLYPDQQRVEKLPDCCQVYVVSPLLKELISKIISLETTEKDDFYRRLEEIICLELGTLEPMDLGLQMPQDRRANRLANFVYENPEDNSPLVDLAKNFGASKRTMVRLFINETGLTFSKWRQRKKILTAIHLMGAGVSVSEASYSLGYKSPSAFTAMFRREMGKTPSEFLIKN